MRNSSFNRPGQWLLLGSGLSLVLLYLFLYRPLSQTARALDQPLLGLQGLLAGAAAESKLASPADFQEISSNLQRVQSGLETLRELRRTLLARLELEPALQSKLEEPFQLIDFQNERQVRFEELNRLAKERRVSIDPTIVTNFLRFPLDLERGNLIWAQLAVSQHALAAAIHSGVTAIRALRLLPTLASSNGVPRLNGCEEISVGLELTGAMSSVSKFLLSLPLRTEEIKNAGLPAPLTNKPALFISRLLLRKQAPEKPEDVHLEIAVSGFVKLAAVEAPRTPHR